MRRLLRFALPAAFVLVSPWMAIPLAAAPDDGPARIVAHRIEARFEPAKHTIVARDLLDLDVSKGRTLNLRLGAGLRLLTVKAVGAAEGTVLTFDTNDGTSTVKISEGAKQLEISYAGEIFDAVTKKDDLTWVVGDATRGIISEKGIYLSGASGWYPTTAADGLARFDVSTFVPEPFLVVTQGGIPERSKRTAAKDWASDTIVAPPAGEGGTVYAASIARAVLATDDCSLSAGPYRVESKDVEGIRISTYFLEGEAKDAGIWLDAAAEIVQRYEMILGTYPHPKFDIVENFFQTGYGMPSYTLLGDEVIRYVTAGAKLAGGKIPPGYLDHEYVHGWFGNGLLVDPKDGNWCEALTTYFSNYLSKEHESEEAAKEYRRGVLEKYALRVRPETDYPVREFRTKTEDKDNDVGYGKGSMIFHMLRRRQGDAEFFSRVKSMATNRVGTYVSWTDWLKALDGEWVRPWLERKGLPAIRLASATSWVQTGEKFPWTIRAEAVVDGPRGEDPWPSTQLEVFVDGRRMERPLSLDGRSGVWSTTVAMTLPKTVELDPNFHVLRRIDDADLPPCLQRTLGAKGAAIAFPPDVAPYASLAKRLAGERGIEILDPAATATSAKPVLALMPAPTSGPIVPEMDAKGVRVSIEPNRIVIGDKTFEGKDHAILLSFLKGGVPQTWFVALSPDMAARARALPYYGWDQVLVFSAAQRNPVFRGFLDRGSHGMRRDVETDPDAFAVIDDVRKLSSDKFGGRRPGTPGHESARTWLFDRLDRLAKDSAKATLVAPFGLGVADLVSSRDLIVTTASGKVTIPNAFRPLYASPERALGSPLPYAEGAGSVPLAGRMADTSPEGLARFWRQIEGGSSPTNLLVLSPQTRAVIAPMLDSPNALTPESEAELAKPGRDGKPKERPDLGPWIAARRARLFADAVLLRVPVLVLEDATVTRLEELSDIKTIDFEIKYGPERAAWADGNGGSNVIAYWPAPDAPEEKPPVVLVSAHYDSFGTVNGVLFRGADDNASGVACVLEALRGVAAQVAAPGSKTGLVVAFFDAEEWGLQGSRAAARMLQRTYDVKSVVNVDAVGRVKNDTVYVVGLSTAKDLGDKAVKALEVGGLRVGPDIDKYAYAEGSDHWPFHQAGIPAITCWASDYGVMNTSKDDPELVDPVGVAKLSKAVRDLILKLLKE